MAVITNSPVEMGRDTQAAALENFEAARGYVQNPSPAAAVQNPPADQTTGFKFSEVTTTRIADAPQNDPTADRNSYPVDIRTLPPGENLGALAEQPRDFRAQYLESAGTPYNVQEARYYLGNRNTLALGDRGPEVAVFQGHLRGAANWLRSRSENVAMPEITGEITPADLEVLKAVEAFRNKEISGPTFVGRDTIKTVIGDSANPQEYAGFPADPQAIQVAAAIYNRDYHPGVTSGERANAAEARAERQGGAGKGVAGRGAVASAPIDAAVSGNAGQVSAGQSSAETDQGTAPTAAPQARNVVNGGVPVRSMTSDLVGQVLSGATDFKRGDQDSASSAPIAPLQQSLQAQLQELSQSPTFKPELRGRLDVELGNLARADTGYFGSRTEERVKILQAANNWEETGKIGQRELALLAPGAIAETAAATPAADTSASTKDTAPVVTTVNNFRRAIRDNLPEHDDAIVSELGFQAENEGALSELRKEYAFQTQGRNFDQDVLARLESNPDAQKFARQILEQDRQASIATAADTAVVNTDIASVRKQVANAFGTDSVTVSATNGTLDIEKEWIFMGPEKIKGYVDTKGGRIPFAASISRNVDGEVIVSSEFTIAGRPVDVSKRKGVAKGMVAAMNESPEGSEFHFVGQSAEDGSSVMITRNKETNEFLLAEYRADQPLNVRPVANASTMGNGFTGNLDEMALKIEAVNGRQTTDLFASVGNATFRYEAV